MRDYEQLLAPYRFWDLDCQERMLTGQNPPNCILQNRAEIVALCQWIEQERIRSYLEIGIWNGHLLTLLHYLFRFERVASADAGFAANCGYPLMLPKDALSYWGLSSDTEFLSFRESLGHLDLVLIDGDHSYEGVKQDYLINVAYPHRFLMFHDITGTYEGTAGVTRVWQELRGYKLEIVRTNPHTNDQISGMGLGIWSAKPFAGATLV